MEELRSMERVLLTLKGEETDRVPVYTLAIGATRQVTGVSFPDFSMNSELAADAMIYANRIIGDDILLAFIDLSVEAGDFGQELIYPQNTTAHPNYDKPLIRDIKDYDRLPLVNVLEGKRMGTYLNLCQRLVERVGKEYPVLGFVYGPLGVLSMMRGTEKLFLDLLRHPKEVKQGLEIVTEVLVNFVQEQCERGVAGVCIDTLPASRSGVSPELWEEFEGPYVQRIGDTIRKHGGLVANHGCGNAPYFSAVAKWLNPGIISFADLPEDCRDAQELKQKYGQETILMGYIPTDLLYLGTPQKVIAECVKQIDILGPGGRYILSPGCEYPPNASLLNARAMVSAAKFYPQFKKTE